jgi:hypothetical protein
MMPAYNIDNKKPNKSLKKVQFIIISMLIFFYVYSINFTFLPTHTSRLVLFVLALFVVFYLNLRKEEVVIPRDIIFIAFFNVIYILLALIGSGLEGFSDLSILNSALLLIFHCFLGGIFFSFLLKYYRVDFRGLVFLLQVVIVYQAIFILIYFVSWDFRDFTFLYIPEGDSIAHQSNLFRSRGLTHAASATLSIVQSFGLLFTAFLVATTNYKSKQNIYFLLSFSLVLCSVILTGRTGLLMIPIVVMYLLYSIFIDFKIRKNSLLFISILPSALALICLVVWLGYKYILGGFETSWGEDGIDRLIRWVSEEFISPDGNIQSKTFDALTAHWFLPSSWGVLFFGDATTWNLNRIYSDVGVIRRLHGTGLVGLITLYLIYIFIFGICILNASGSEAKMMLLSLCIFLFITELKEPFLTKLDISCFIMLFFSYLVINRKIDTQTNKVGF